MKSRALIGAILMTAAAFAVTPSARAANDFEKPLKAAIPNGTYKVVHEETVAGTKTETFEITVPNAPAAYATTTENGDLLAIANSHTAAELPPAVAEVTSTLFGVAPTNIWAMTVHEYSVNVTNGNQTYVMNVNAAGAVVSISTNQQMALEDPHQAPKADKAETAGIDKLVEAKFPGVKITSINKSLAAPGFYAVEFMSGNEPGWVVISKDNHIRSYSMHVAEASVPKPVLAAVAEIKGAKITGISAYSYNVWDATETLSGDSINIHVRPDGTVMEVESKQAKAMKETMKAKQGK